MYCMKCGALNSEENKHCIECGAPISEASQPTKKHSKLAFLPILFFMLIFIFAIIVCFGKEFGLVALILSLVLFIVFAVKKLNRSLSVAGIVITPVLLIVSFLVMVTTHSYLAADSRIIAATASQTPTQKAFSVGDIYEAPGVKLTLVDIKPLDEFTNASDNSKYYQLHLLIENTGSTAMQINGSLIKGAFADDTILADSFMAGAGIPSSIYGEIPPGKKLDGAAIYEVPNDWKTLEFILDPSALGQPPAEPDLYVRIENSK